MIEVLKQNLDIHKERYINNLKDIISINTEVIGHGIDGGKEKEGQEFIEKILTDLGADITKDQLDEERIIKAFDLYKEGNKGHCYNDRYNLYGILKGRESNKSLLFNGHIDTMPCGDLDKWTSNPWQPEIRDGKLFGLGSADMKAGLMAAISAYDLIKNANIKLNGDVMINSVVDEEGGGNGTITAMMHGNKADAAVVCEPTDDQIIIAHMGFVFFEITTKGIAVHSGDKWKGVSAIEKMLKVMDGLNELENEWSDKYSDPLLPSPNLNVGVINGGTAGSTVADMCSIKICVHYLPDIMDYDSVVNEIVGKINEVAEKDDWLRDNKPEYHIYQAGGGFKIQDSHLFVKQIKDSFSSASNKTVVSAGCPAGNDARIIKNIGKIPTVISGPGKLEQCHSIDEYVSIDRYLEYILKYAKLMLDFCGHERR